MTRCAVCDGEIDPRDDLPFAHVSCWAQFQMDRAADRLDEDRFFADRDI